MKSLSFCAKVGMLHGIVVGFLFGALLIEHPTLGPFSAFHVGAALLLAAAAVLMSLGVLVVLMRFPLGSVLLPTVVNALLVSALTVALLSAVGGGPMAALLGVTAGAVVGVAVGYLLCRSCREWAGTK